MELKSLHKDAIPNALAKAERYRLLHEPWQSESICQDVLRVDPENQAALVTLLLALTDQFGQAFKVQEAKDVVPRLKDEYDRCYYSGIISERRAQVFQRSTASSLPGGRSSSALSYQSIALRYQP